MRILFKNLLLDNFIMSRRTAPTAGRQQQQQQRTPQPSIRSSQAFAPQPTREQTQYQQMNAKKQLQQQQRDYQEENERVSQVGGTTKITVAQAITLITLRLTSIETKLTNGEFGLSSNINESIDNETLINVSNRLDALETKINLSSSTDYKQQIDSLTQALIQSKNISNTLMKENKDLKTQMTNFKKEMTDIKLIENVKNLVTSNESKIYQMLNVQCDFQLEEGMDTLNENDLNLSDSEAGSILETDIRQSLSVTGYEDNDEELNMTKITELQEQNQPN